MISIDDIEAMADTPYFKHMGDVILNDGYTYIDAELHIFNLMDDAAEQEDWVRYAELAHDLHQLEDNYS